MKNLFVLLPAHRDASKHAADFAAGIAADESPWGFSKASNRGYKVEFSKGKDRSALDRVVRRLLGCDFLHAWRRRSEMAKADAVITHTENEYLAAALALRLSGIKKPVIQGNTLWLFHEAGKLNALQKLVTRFGLARVDILTCNATPNVQGGRSLTSKPVHYIPYGISLESFPLVEPRLRPDGLMLAVGNDRARDWGAIEGVARAHPDIPIRIASSAAPTALAKFGNVVVAPTRGVAEMNTLYDEARFVLIPVNGNWHASGITVMLECVARGVPVIAADEGGLGDYFGSDEITFYGPDREDKTITDAVSRLIADPQAAFARARKAQARFVESRYDSQSFIDKLLGCITTAGGAVARSA